MNAAAFRCDLQTEAGQLEGSPVAIYRGPDYLEKSLRNDGRSVLQEILQTGFNYDGKGSQENEKSKRECQAAESGPIEAPAANTDEKHHQGIHGQGEGVLGRWRLG